LTATTDAIRATRNSQFPILNIQPEVSMKSRAALILTILLCLLTLAACGAKGTVPVDISSPRATAATLMSALQVWDTAAIDASGYVIDSDLEGETLSARMDSALLKK